MTLLRRAAACATSATLLIGTLVGGAGAASMSDIRAQARAIAISPGAGGAGERGAVERLGQLAVQFLDAADAGQDGAVATYEALVDPLERSYDANRAGLDRMSQGVIDADGNLDTLYESAEYQERQALAAQALYYLNWLRYRGALFYDGAKRRGLLQKAVEGFSEFTTASGSPIAAESLLGRGLAQLELDQTSYAIADFEAVIDAKNVPAERARKARLALADAYVKAGRAAEALRASKQAVESATPADEARAKLIRVRALAMAAAGSPGQRSSYLAEAQSLLSDVQAAGGPWAGRAAAIARAGLNNPKVWASGAKAQAAKAEPPPPSEWDVTKRLVATGKYKDAIPRLEGVLVATDEEERKNASEARYLLGIAYFRTNDLPKAIATFDEVLKAPERAGYRDDAAYLRFKASEAIYAANATPERLPAYEQAINAFLAEYPKHKAAAEARYRLGEIRQRAEQYDEAIAEYARVQGDPGFELRAAFATAQSAVKLLERTSEGAKLDRGLTAKAQTALDRFWSQIRSQPANAFGDAPVNDLMGPAALMNAYLAALDDPPQYETALNWLGGFEEKHPKLAAEQGPQIVKLRLAALSRLGRLIDAPKEAARPAVAELDPAFLDDVASRFLTFAAREQAAGDKAAGEAGRRAALSLTERALASKTELDAAIRRRLLMTSAKLYEDGGQRDKALPLYREVLAAQPDQLPARAGAARILEAQGKTGDARALWEEITAARGRSGWLEAQYQSARLSVALGETATACARLREVPAEMINTSNAETPKRIQELLRTTCGNT